MIELINFYGAALLSRCYTQHALLPYIDSESNYIRQLNKVQFVNNGIEFIKLPVYLKINLFYLLFLLMLKIRVTYYFYKYNKPIRSTIFNKLVT